MNAAGIDISKGKSMVSVMRPLDEVVAKPFTVRYSGSERKELADYLKNLDGETRVIMEHTGRYYEPVAQYLHDARLYVSAVNLKNNLIALLDQTYPGVNALFGSPAREDGTQKWVDFAASFWHVDCVRGMSQAAFTERYRKWCKRNRYNFSSDKAAEIYTGAKDQIAMIPKDDLTKRLIRQTIDSLNTVSKTVEQLKAEMLKLASQLPEFPVVMEMHSVGDSLGPQLMAEIGDVTRFIHRGSITAFAGVDPGANQSSEREAKSVRTSKSGPPELRRTLFLVMDGLLKSMPQDDPVYQFMDKKRAVGKPYLVYMTAGANKFLRIYYGRVKEYLASLETAD